MSWFPPVGQSPQDGWRFDIVSLLAIIGESTLEGHVQIITASSFAWLPRLLPAPQTVLKTERPARLPPVKDVVIVGVRSGIYLTELNFFADIIHDVASLQDFEFQVYEIDYAKKGPRELEETGPRKWTWSNQKLEPVYVPVKKLCALNVVIWVSVFMTIGLFIWAGLIHDGVAMIALVTMSLSTSLACLSSEWYPVLSHRPTTARVPRGDIVISTRNGAFVVVKCSEEITRELYGGTEKCRYVFGETWHRILLGTSTVLLMASVLLFSNCGWTMQAAIGIAYIILNILYWAVPLVMHRKSTWDMSRYEIKSRVVKPRSDSCEGPSSYTETLWYAIRETERTDWVINGKLAPSSEAWRKWLDEARDNCHPGSKWDAVAAKNRLMHEAAQDSHQLPTAAPSLDEAPRSSGEKSSS
ncbi:uncharacterized protein ACLA_018260 [Aspergillus clavatus NRRL 1]|uniref:Uncharacterized protein n=1 Tax=Aspergillus clavatus (strain ATCC 1007 / CBS 513.65 / DSM 816 / NCTC 3887 / NRRL 1 / QM 1276 / 107) TaxID=344612 RepID=A1CNA1_ASPCL|nr:uncharacterized protein ACLA_018260 [Aspergillus clavatus NRRL 1]EAW07122.1 conserved hypothetical protein [Aspergillus clavatus NRRL 1]